MPLHDLFGIRVRTLNKGEPQPSEKARRRLHFAQPLVPVKAFSDPHLRQALQGGVCHSRKELVRARMLGLDGLKPALLPLCRADKDPSFGRPARESIEYGNRYPSASHQFAADYIFGGFAYGQVRCAGNGGRQPLGGLSRLFPVSSLSLEWLYSDVDMGDFRLQPVGQIAGQHHGFIDRLRNGDRLALVQEGAELPAFAPLQKIIHNKVWSFGLG